MFLEAGSASRSSSRSKSSTRTSRSNDLQAKKEQIELDEHSRSNDLQAKKEQIELNEHSQIERRSDGGYNTVFGAPDHPGYIWRISKGHDLESRKRHLKEWIEETKIISILSKLNITPRVVRKYSQGSWLTDTQTRVALLQERYTEDLHDAMVNSKNPHLYFGEDPKFGAAVGHALARRMHQLGALCLLHGDLKPENVLVKVNASGKLAGLRIIDLDPQFLFVGCDCLTPALSEFLPGVGKADRSAYACAFYALINLVLFWTWFEVYRYVSTEKGKPIAIAIQKCHEVLSKALAKSSFPLDIVAPGIPEQLKRRLHLWCKNYRNSKQPLQKDKPVWAAACERFPSLCVKNYKWTRGPLVDNVPIDKIPWKGCTKAPDECERTIEEARRNLVDVARNTRDMTCASGLQLTANLAGA